MAAKQPAAPPPTDADAPGAAAPTTSAEPSTGRTRSARRSGGGDRRFYVDSQRRRYWSVTTFLRAVPKDALPGWAAGVTAEAAIDNLDLWAQHRDRFGRDAAVKALRDVRWNVSRAAADKGRAVHAAIERWVLEQPLPDSLTDVEERYVEQFLDFLDRHRPEIVAAELTVFNVTHGYAGTLDLIATFPRLPGAPTLLIDTKTGSGVYSESALQLAAYRNAEHCELADGREVRMPSVDGCAVLHLTEDAWDLTPVETGKIRENDGSVRDVFTTFLYVREMYRWLHELSRSVVGAPFPVPPRGDERPTMIELAVEAEAAVDADGDTDPTGGDSAERT